MKYEGVYVILQACSILVRKNIPIKMVFVGSGEEYEGMFQYVKEYHLEKNVLIYGRIPKETVPALQRRGDICIAHLDEPGHPGVFQYGVSKIKVSEYLYSGSVVLFGFRNANEPAIKLGGAIQFTPFDADDLARKIEDVIKMDKSSRTTYGKHGQEYTRQYHSVEKLTDTLESVFFK